MMPWHIEADELLLDYHCLHWFSFRDRKWYLEGDWYDNLEQWRTGQ